MAYVRRKIDLTITLGTGDFGDGRGNTVECTGLRVSASIAKTTLPAADQAEIRVWGLTGDLMNRISTLGKPIARFRTNTITVKAGDESGMSQVFFGYIMEAYNDFADQPNASLNFTCLGAAVDAAKPVPALSFKGNVDVATVAAQIAASMGKNLKNDGVTGIHLNNPYYPGTALAQLNALVAATGINADPNDQAVLEIWPRDTARPGAIPYVSPDTGLIGYPQYCDLGIAVRTLYQPGFLMGGQFELKTSIDPANGKWAILNRLTYELESETPGGKWEVYMTGGRLTMDGGEIP